MDDLKNFKYLLDKSVKAGDLIEFAEAPSGFICPSHLVKKYNILSPLLYTGIFLGQEISYRARVFVILCGGKIRRWTAHKRP